MQQKNQPQRQRQVDDQRIQPLDRVDAEQEPGRDLNEQQQNAEQRDRPPLPPALAAARDFHAQTQAEDQDQAIIQNADDNLSGHSSSLPFQKQQLHVILLELRVQKP